MTISPQDEAKAILRRNGKSFWFASLFLPRQVAADAARLYTFCRTMDDLADIAVTEESHATLAQVRQDLQRGATSHADVKGFLELAQHYKLPRDAADYLIATFIQDATTELLLEDESALVRYCYGVAGTVGLMMSPLLGADCRQAHVAGVHLGIAMQMTNIARDVLEDARNQRRYIPGSWLAEMTAQQIVHASASETSEAKEIVAGSVARLLELADQYYASAANGFPLIPIRARRGIEIAAAVYREIGVVLHHNHHDWWSGRVHVSLRRKLWIAVQVYVGRSPIRRLRAHVPTDSLSQPLTGLPGAR